MQDLLLYLKICAMIILMFLNRIMTYARKYGDNGCQTLVILL